jgi:CRP-like cAMP-binding protein
VSDARLQLLQSMPIFGGITSEVLALVLSLAEEITIPKDAMFFREGDVADSLYVLERGQVAILKDWEGQRYLLRYLKENDCFGEMAWIDLSPRSASVRALEDCVALKLPYSAFQEVLQRDLEQYAMMQMNMAREVSRRLRTADHQLFEARVQAKVIDGHMMFYST